MEVYCQYCNHSFSSDKNLKAHQKTTKYCLKLQKEDFQNTKYIKDIKNICDFCNKDFSNKYTLNSHYSNCKEKIIHDRYVDKEKELKDIIERKERELLEKERYFRHLLEEKERNFNHILEEKDRELFDKDKHIKDLLYEKNKLQDTISEIAKNTKTITHNTTNNTNVIINNTLNLNDVSRIQSVLDQNLDGNVLCNGQKGLARMIYDKLLKGEDGKSIYKCVDPSRHNFEYINEEGKLERDVKANKLTNALIKGDVCQKAMDVGKDLWTKDDGSTDSTRFEAFSDKVMEVANITKDDSKFRSELSALTS